MAPDSAQGGSSVLGSPSIRSKETGKGLGDEIRWRRFGGSDVGKIGNPITFSLWG